MSGPTGADPSGRMPGDGDETDGEAGSLSDRPDVDPASLYGRPADTGFLLAPLAVLVFTTAALLATTFGLTVLVPPGCGLSNVFDYPCSGMLPRMSNFFNLLVVPGAALFLWQSRLHRRRTRPLVPGMFPAAEAVIARMLASVALPRPVPVVLGPRLGRRAFTGGTGAKPYVACGPELLALPGKGAAGRQVFEAVLRHELAHVQNRDLLRHHFASSLRISTRTAALLTGLLLVAELAWAERPLSPGAVVGVLVRAALLAVAAELVARAFFRTREHQADVRAAGGDPAGIRAALHGGRERRRGLREHLLSRHPTVAARLAEIDGGATVLAFPLGQVLAGGVFTAVGLTNVQAFLDLLVYQEVLEPPGPSDAVSWIPLLALLGAAGLPTGLFLALGVSRDARGRRLTGRPVRPWRIGLVFAVGLVAGLFLAPYAPLLYRTAPAGPPPLAGLALAAAAGVALCHWLTATVRPLRSTGRVPGVLLVAALPVAAGALVLFWETLLRYRTNEVGCEHLAGCGPWGLFRIAVAGLASPWVAAMLVLATVTLLTVAVRRTRPSRAVLRTAGTVTLAGALLAALPLLPGADALAADWSRLDPRLSTGSALVLQAALLVAVAVAATAPVGLAGPLAGGAALAVATAGLIFRLIDAAREPVALGVENLRYQSGVLLGEVLALALLAAVATLGVRALAARLRSGRTGRPPLRPRQRVAAGRPVRLDAGPVSPSGAGPSGSRTGRAGAPGPPGDGPPPRS
ncbi:M48 family metalloprotease [Micromonospora sp. NPDC048830]|uniref:M48 family metalloprotease n=1 Tax=Micromonospora sp. NPDC048830 TaxID=3364257 RepID=UPI00371B0C63